MKKLFKIAAIITAVLLILIAAALIFVKSYLTEDRMRAFISEFAEKSLNRKVAIGAIEVSLFRGVVVKGFEVREKDPQQAFLTTKEFVLKYQFLPLLSKQLVIDKLAIEDTEIHVTANPDGTYNFSDMVKPGKMEEKEKERAAGLPVNLDVKSISVKNARLIYTDAAGKLKKADLLANAELSITGISKNMLSSEGSLNTLLSEARLKDGGKTLKDIKMDARYKIDMDMEAKQVTVHSINAEILKIPVNMQGGINYAAETSYNLDVKVPGYNLAELRKDILTAFLPAGTALGGNVSMQLNVNKKPEKGSPARFNGTVNMAMVSFGLKGLNLVLDGSIGVLPEIISLENLKLIAGQNRADISGSVKNYQEYPDLNVKITSKSINLDELMAPAAVPAKEQAPAKGEAGKEPEPLDLKMRATATLDIEKTRYKDMSMTNFRSRYELNKNVLRIPYLNGNTLRGAFAVKGAVDLARRGTSYKINSDLKGISIEELTGAFAPSVKGKLTGILSGKADITGAGTLPENIKRNLKGKGEFAIKNGSLKNSELSARFLQILGLQELREIPIEKANGRFNISDGIVNLTTAIGSKDMTIDEKGTIGMDQKLDLSILVRVSDRLAPKVVSQSSIAKFLSGEKGWTALPLRVGGTISQPSYGVDTKAVGKKAAEGIQKRIGEEIFKRLPKEQQPGTDQQKKPSPRDLLEGLFK